MKNKLNFNSIKELFGNDKEFMEALDDALILEKIKTPTKFSIEVEDIEEQLFKMVPSNNKKTFEILLVNYKRYFYKHIKEID